MISSPLTRALRTALIVYEDEKILVHPGFAELHESWHHQIPENLGRPLSQLLEDPSLSFHGIERVDFTYLQDWPNQKESYEHLGLEFLATRSEKRFVVFTHHNWIINVLRHHSPRRVQNCCQVHVFLQYDGKKVKVYPAESPHQWCNPSYSFDSDTEDQDDAN